MGYHCMDVIFERGKWTLCGVNLHLRNAPTLEPDVFDRTPTSQRCTVCAAQRNLIVSAPTP